MEFTRTDLGISNLALFYAGCDIIVFVEGGDPELSADEFCESVQMSHSIDCLFWNFVFKSFDKKSTKAQFIAVGGKNVAKDLAKRISEGKIANTIVAMDRDYDVINKTIFNHPKVLYTYGYSWENDLWRPNIIQKFFSQVSNKAISESTQEKIEEAFERLSKQCKRLSIAQYIYNAHGISFLPTQKWQSVLRDASPPALNMTRICKLAGEAKKKRVGMANPAVPKLRNEFDFPGKLYKEYGYLLVRYATGEKIAHHHLEKWFMLFCQNVGKTVLGTSQQNYYTALIQKAV